MYKDIKIIENIVKLPTKVFQDTKNVIVRDTGFVKKDLERSPNIDGFVKEVSESISHSVSTSPIAKVKSIIPLNRESSCSSFFGVTSPENIMQKIHNQLALTTLKSEEQFISNFPILLIDCSYPYTSNIKMLENSITNLFKSGTGRLTMMGKTFGSEQATHTIGLVFDRKNNVVYVLDSLPKEVQSQYRNSIVRTLSNDRDVKVLFSSKPQQQMNEYTCNNWTHANIETVQGAIKDGKVLSEDELNAMLPSDINEILKSQMNYLTNDHKSAYTNFLRMCGV